MRNTLPLAHDGYADDSDPRMTVSGNVYLGVIIPPRETPTLRRYRKQPSPRRLEFLDAGAMLPLPDALESHAGRADVLVWCGNDAGRRLSRDDIHAAAAVGWEVSNYRSEMRSATFRRNGVSLDVRSSVPWFGNASDAELIREAWYDLGRWLRSGFGDWAYLWPTPTLTGQELLRGTLPYGMQYPVLPPELIELLLVNLGGGRTEVLTAPGALNGKLKRLPGVLNLDMRWSYASCLHALPVGEAVLDKTPGHPLTVGEVGYEPSFYWFRARIPADWRHIGLLPRRVRAAGEVSTTYPHKACEEFSGWATGAEVRVALVAGWAVWSNAKLWWPQTGRHDPAKMFITTLRALRGRVEKKGAEGDLRAPLVASALRNLVVHTVGAFNRLSRIDEGFNAYGHPERIPHGAIPTPVDGGWQWRRDIVHLDEWTHPEWFATVAGRVRAKTAARALQLPPESIVAIRTDGIMTTLADPEVIDAGTPGSWRVKWRMPGPLAAPRNTPDVLRLIRWATGSGGEDYESDHRDAEED